MKKIKFSFLSVLSVFLLASCGLESPADEESGETNGDSGAAEPEVTLTYAEVNPLDTIAGQTGEAFKERVEELSNGEIEIDIQASGVLGSENDVLDEMLGGGGTVDISRISAFGLTNYGGEKSTLLSLPFTFVDRDHYWNFVNSDLSEEFLQEPHENGVGIRGLFYGEEGFRHFFMVNEAEGIDDLSGTKLRVSNDPIMNGMVQGLNADPTVVSFGELYSALQTGVVDGAEQPIVNIASNAFQEVAPNLILDGHTIGAIQVVIADGAWDSLSEEHQEILMEAGELASETNREVSEEMEEEVLQELIDEGTNVIEVEDITPWQEAVEDVVQDNVGEYSDLYQQIIDLQ